MQLRNQVCSVLFYLSMCWACAGALAGECLNDTRQVQLTGGSTKLRSYLCKLDATAERRLRIEFHRLSEAAAGNVIQGNAYHDLQRLLGRVHVAQNSVQAEAKKLFDQFGRKETVSNCYRTTVQTPRGGKDYDRADGGSCTAKRVLWYFSFPDREDMTAIGYPLPQDEQHIKDKSTWPDGYNFMYGKCAEGAARNSIVECTSIWRYANSKDIDNYSENVRIQERSLGLDSLGAGADPTIKDSAPLDESESVSDSSDRYFRLIRYLTRDGWPDDFLALVGNYNGCGGFGFELHVRQLVLDVALIENVGRDQIVLDGLLGNESVNRGLRKTQSSLDLGSLSPVVINSRIEIKPGEKALVPLRLVFAPAESLRSAVPNSAESRTIWERIRSAPRGTVFRNASQTDGVIKKVHESFKAPSAPSLEPSVYGPEIALRGFVSNGERVVLDQSARNFIQITAGDGYGSCPFLYSWDERLKTWIWHGKVIHRANSKEKEMKQEISLSSLATRFRLREEELELSHIDLAVLRVNLTDGSQRVLLPGNDALAKEDGVYAKIKAGQTLQFEFQLSPHIAPEDVVASTLILKGYYEPYSRLERVSFRPLEVKFSSDPQ